MGCHFSLLLCPRAHSSPNHRPCPSRSWRSVKRARLRRSGGGEAAAGRRAPRVRRRRAVRRFSRSIDQGVGNRSTDRPFFCAGLVTFVVPPEVDGDLAPFVLPTEPADDTENPTPLAQDERPRNTRKARKQTPSIYQAQKSQRLTPSCVCRAASVIRRFSRSVDQRAGNRPTVRASFGVPAAI